MTAVNQHGAIFLKADETPLAKALWGSGAQELRLSLIPFKMFSSGATRGRGEAEPRCSSDFFFIYVN